MSRSRRRCCAASEEALFRPEGASTRVARAHRVGRGCGRARRVRGCPEHNSPAGGAGVGVRWPAELAPRRARAADYALIDGRRRRGPGRFHADWGHARRASAPSSYPKCHGDWRDTHDTEEGSGIDAAERAGRCLCCLGGVRGRVLSRKCWNEHQHGRWCVSAGPRGAKVVKSCSIPRPSRYASQRKTAMGSCRL